MRLSQRQIRTIENELEKKNTLTVWARGRRILIKRRQRHIYPSAQNTKVVRISNEDWEKIAARAKRDGISMAIAVDNMLIEAYRCKITRLLQSVLMVKAS